MLDLAAAEAMNDLFFEVVIAPAYTDEALDLLKSKKNRIILKSMSNLKHRKLTRTLLNGTIEQDRDLHTDAAEDLAVVTEVAPTEDQQAALLFASKVCKHSKSNAIVLAAHGATVGIGAGQMSRIDAAKLAVGKSSGRCKGAIMASDAFFPFKDVAELAATNGILAIIQPGGSVNDKETIEACNKYRIAMVFTGKRHFKH